MSLKGRMGAEMEGDLTTATVPLSLIEYRLNFAESLLGEWNQNGSIINALIRALRPWDIQLSGVSIKPATANLGEVQVTFEVIPQRLAFHLFLGSATLVGANFGWADAPMFVKLIQAIRPALVENAKVDIASQQVTLAMHLTPQGKSVSDLTSRFYPFREEDRAKHVRAAGFSVYMGDNSYSVDLSLVYKDSLFVRLIRNFDSSRPLDEIVATLQDDQTTLLNQLKLRLQ